MWPISSCALCPLVASLLSCTVKGENQNITQEHLQSSLPFGKPNRKLNCIYASLDTTAFQRLLRDPLHKFVKHLRNFPGKMTPCENRRPSPCLSGSLCFVANVAPEGCLDQLGLIVSKSAGVSSCSHCWPIEGPRLTKFSNQNKSIHISAVKPAPRREGLGHSFPPSVTSKESNILIHRVSQREARNLFCFVQHIGTVTSSYDTVQNPSCNLPQSQQVHSEG